MKVTYDPEVDVLRILLHSTMAEEDGDESGVILDYDEDGHIVGLEILDASERIEPLLLTQRRAFMQLPLADRRRLLAEQAERMAAHYQPDPERDLWQGGDFAE